MFTLSDDILEKILTSGDLNERQSTLLRAYFISHASETLLRVSGVEHAMMIKSGNYYENDKIYKLIKDMKNKLEDVCGDLLDSLEDEEW